MAVFPVPSQIQNDYLIVLKSIKPSLNTLDANSDFVIRGKAMTGILSGVYGDQAKINLDTWIASCRPESLFRFGIDYNLPQQPATQADCPSAAIAGTDGTVINPGDLTFIYPTTAIVYTNTTGGTFADGTLNVAIKCAVSGQIGNISAPDTLQIVNPPTGVGSSAILNVDMADGTDQESVDSYRARLLSRRQNSPAGGNQTDYPAFAFEGDPSIRTALIRRFGRGLGTVDVYITTGTTDIDTAVTQGQSIVRIPSGDVIAEEQAYYNAHVPLTDCPGVFAPTELAVNATVYIVLAAGLTMGSIPSDPIYNPLGLNCQQLVQREVSRALYKIPVGGRKIPGSTSGEVPASDIEEGLDIWLSAVTDVETGLYTGKLPIIADRRCGNMDGSNRNLSILGNQLPKPGTITVVTGGI